MTCSLELDQVRSGYGRIEVLHGVDLQVPAGSVVALLGPNGVGKTTTLRAISGGLPVTSGAIRLDGRRIDNRRPSAIARRGLRLIPEGRGIFPSLSVRDNLRVAHRSAPREMVGPWEEWLLDITETFPGSASGSSRRPGACRVGSSRCSPCAGPWWGGPSS